MTEFFVVETVVQSRETREDLANEDVVTLPIVAGPFEDVENAEMEARGEQYVVVAVPQDTDIKSVSLLGYQP